MAGPRQIVRLSCYQGVDLSETFVFFDKPANGSTDPTSLVPANFTGATARMAIRLAQDPTSTSLLTLATGSGLTFVAGTISPGPATPAYNNGIKIVITKAQSLAMNGGVPISGCYYDLLVDNVDGTTSLLLCGSFDLLPTVTR